VIVHVAGRRHPRRLEDPLSGELGQTLPRRPFHDERGEKEAGVAVGELGAGLKVRRVLPADDIERLRRRRDVFHLPAAQCHQRDVVAQPAGVRQQVPDRDGRAVPGQLRKVLPHVVVEGELAVARQ
jgi:hypothetical protein